MPELRLDAVDAAELAELLQFLSRWLARDRGRLDACLEEFAGHLACNVSQLRQDLDRFTLPARRRRRRVPVRPRHGRVR